MYKKISIAGALLSLALFSGCVLQQPAQKTSEEPSSAGTSLNLSGRGLKNIPMDVFDKTALQSLDVSDNQLTGAIPAEIRKLKNLKVLKANNNLMTGVPAEIGQLTNLETLDLSNNKITGLPYELGNLKNLRVLNLAGNSYSELDLGIIRQSLPQTNFVLK
jgi:Leucine-rich repeat (LRR) protein